MGRMCEQVLMVLLVMWQGCGTQVVAKQLVSGGFGVSRVVGTCSRGVLRACVGFSVISGLWAVVLSGAELGVWLTTMVTWLLHCVA